MGRRMKISPEQLASAAKNREESLKKFKSVDEFFAHFTYKEPSKSALLKRSAQSLPSPSPPPPQKAAVDADPPVAVPLVSNPIKQSSSLLSSYASSISPPPPEPKPPAAAASVAKNPINPRKFLQQSSSSRPMSSLPRNPINPRKFLKPLSLSRPSLSAPKHMVLDSNAVILALPASPSLTTESKPRPPPTATAPKIVEQSSLAATKPVPNPAPIAASKQNLKKRKLILGNQTEIMAKEKKSCNKRGSSSAPIISPCPNFKRKRRVILADCKVWELPADFMPPIYAIPVNDEDTEEEIAQKIKRAKKMSHKNELDLENDEEMFKDPIAPYPPQMRTRVVVLNGKFKVITKYFPLPPYSILINDEDTNEERVIKTTISREVYKKRRRPRSCLTPEEKMNDAYKRIANDDRNNKWVPPTSRYKLLQERHYWDPWRVLVICMLLNITTAKQVKKILKKLFKLCPDAEAAINVPDEELQNLIRPLGLWGKRTMGIKKLSSEYLGSEWTHVHQLYGVGKYAADAYAIFCVGKPEEVVPDDHKLVPYWKFVCSLRSLKFRLRLATYRLRYAKYPERYGGY